MSAWSDNPEWFDEWIIKRCLAGDHGELLRKMAEEGHEGWALWNRLDQRNSDEYFKATDNALREYWGQAS